MTSASSCPRAPCSWPPARRPTSPTRRSIPARSAGRPAALLPGLPRGEAGRRRVRPRAGRRRLLHVARHGRPLRHLLRRQPPAIHRQRRQGDGVGQGRLPARRRALRRRDRRRSIRPRSPRATTPWRRLVVALDDAAAGARRARRPPDAHDRRGDREGAGRGAALPSRAVLPAAELRAAQSARARGRPRRVAADGGHRAHRRVGGSRAGPAVADHARDGRLEPAVRVPAARGARGGDGPDGHAHRDPRSVGRAAGRRRPRQRRAVLDRQGAEGAGQPGHLLRRLQERRGPLQARGDRGGDRPGDLGHRHRRGDRARPPAGRPLPRQHRAGDGRLRRRDARRAQVPLEGRDAHHRHRLGPHDERRAGWRATARCSRT